MLNSVQILRALAAWIVVFHHYIQIFGYGKSNEVSNIIALYGSIGVDIFFVISGFVIFTSASQRSLTPGEFFIQRAARIVPAYWIFTLITAATIYWAPSIMPLLGVDSISLLKSLFFIPTPNPSGIGIYPILTVGWTLNYEVLFYAIFFLSLFLPRALLAPAIFFGVIISTYILPKMGGSFLFYGAPIVYEFLLGIIISIIYQLGLLKRINPMAAIPLVAISIAAVALMPDTDTHDPMRLGIPSAIIVIAIISQERYLPRLSILTKLGDFSYSTYLIHPIVIWYMLSAKNHFDLNLTLTLIITCSLIMVFSWWSFAFIELPISKLTKKRVLESARQATSPT